MIDAYRSGFADDLPHHATRLHHANCAQGFVCYADAATCHKHILDVTRIETSIRNWIAIIAIDASIMFGDRYERIVRKFLCVLLFWIVKINTPCARDTTIRKLLFGNDIILRENQIAHELSRFARASDECNPS